MRPFKVRICHYLLVLVWQIELRSPCLHLSLRLPCSVKHHMYRDCSETERNCSEIAANCSYLPAESFGSFITTPLKEKGVEQLATTLTFGPFRLLPVQRQLWKDEEQLELRAMPLAVLTYLTQHPERVVSAEELRKAVWGGIYVSRTTIRVCVREIRQALGEEAATPRYLETIGRQGYCFIGFSDPEV